MATTLRMKPDIENRYNNLASSTGRSKAFYLNEALASSIDRLEYEYGLLRDVEEWRAGRAETYTLDEVRAHHGLAD